MNTSSSIDRMRFVLRVGVVGVHEAEQLDLLELVHPQDPAGVLAVRAGFAPEARGVPDVAQGQRVGVEQFVEVQRGQRHLRGPHQVVLVVTGGEQLLFVGRQEPGAVHRLLAHQHRGDDRHVAVRHGDVHGVAHQRELEQRGLVLEVGEAGTRHLGATGQVDRVGGLEQLHVVAWRAFERWPLPDRAHDHAVALDAVGRVGVRQVRHPRERGGVGCLDLREFGLGAGDRGLELRGAGDQRGPVGSIGTADRLRRRALLGPGRVDRGDRCSTPDVEVGQGRERRCVHAPAGERGGDPVGVIGEQTRIDHGGQARRPTNRSAHASRPTSPLPGGRWRRRRRSGRLRRCAARRTVGSCRAP